jgi:hypothetical protein
MGLGWRRSGAAADGSAVFCMECGPDAGMEPDPEAGVERCPRCGRTAPLPLVPLFVVTGASWAGKSAIGEGLRVRLPECLVFDADVLLALAGIGPDEPRRTWLWLAYWIARHGRPTVLCGPLVPGQLEALPARSLAGPIHYCALDGWDEVLARRLQARPAWRGSTPEFVEDQRRFAIWLRTHVQPAIDTGGLSVEEIADAVARWVSSHLVEPSRAGA